MLKRYIGNKTDLTPEIVTAVNEFAEPGARIGDLFAGTMSVAMALKEAGYNVVANDINLFSCVHGVAFVQNNSIPELDLTRLVPAVYHKVAFSLAAAQMESVRGRPGFLFLNKRKNFALYADLLALLNYLFHVKPEVSELKSRTSYIYDTYCEAGANSRFVSARGSEGKRRFFSPENAKRIDNILCQLRSWRRNGAISGTLYSLICSVLVRAVEKVSNTQGTYHDFPRDRYDSRALKAITFEPPPFDITLVGGNHLIGKAEDSLEFAKRIPDLDVLYLDPPYNFRQYTAYYFFPNLLCEYSDIRNLKEYFSQIQFVRGQNMKTDFTSTFCKSSMFIDSLSKLIKRTGTRAVVLSYFNGRNHWNEFKSECNGKGIRELETFFSSSIFERGSTRRIPITRLNYQSYGGYKAREVEEYLFVAETKRSKQHRVGSRPNLIRQSAAR